MPRFSKRSLDNLAQCHPDLQRVAHECIKHYNFTVVCGHRNEEDQEKAFKDGFSNAHFGESPHNFTPALAFDAYSYPINVHDEVAARRLVAAMLAAAAKIGVQIESGSSWGDKPHFQLKGWKKLRSKLQETDKRAPRDNGQ